MSKYFGKCFGPSTPAPKSSFWLRCPSFLLSKFASQLNLIQFVYGSGYLESESKVQFSGSCSQDFGSQSRNFQVPGSWVSWSQSPRVSGSRVSGSQVSGPDFRLYPSRFLGIRVPEFRVSESRVPGLRVPGPGSQVLILDHTFGALPLRFKTFCEKISF